MRNLRGNKLDHTGREFNIRQYSSASTIIERTKQKAVEDRKFAKRIEQIKCNLKVSQEQTSLTLKGKSIKDLTQL